ncbi:MAG: Rieske 2Fe-2S domain-containing protein [Proteobacteria bacterium]|nr:Rieske 2Fe-2S domain-containing protein [Pseudomonadota bacterium]
MPEVQVDLAQIPDGGATIVSAGERLKVAVFRVGDRCAAINNRCPHAGGSLGEGAFDGTTVQCPLHGFRVDVWRGIGNAGKPVKKYPVTVEGGRACISVPD